MSIRELTSVRIVLRAGASIVYRISTGCGPSDPRVVSGAQFGHRTAAIPREVDVAVSVVDSAPRQLNSVRLKLEEFDWKAGPQLVELPRSR
jgi:hypothetical protein